jgi:Gamma-glutamyltranspeptidase
VAVPSVDAPATPTPLQEPRSWMMASSNTQRPSSRRSVSFVGNIHPDADNYHDDEREPLLTRDGQKRTKRRLTALLNSRRRAEGDLELPYRDTDEEEPRSWKAVLAISFTVCAVLFLIVAAGLVVASNPIPGSGRHHSLPGQRNPSYLIHATRGAVASESETCSKIGVDILKEGGNAIDAAIAATLCVGVVNMFSSGIGGGGFMTVKLPSSEDGHSAWTVDFRETAPTGSNSTMFLKDPKSSIEGGLAVGVPGEIRGMAAAHSRWGKLPWKRLFRESVKLAQEFTVSTMLQTRLQVRSRTWMDSPD